MSDGLTLTFDDDLADRIRALAEQAGVTPHAFVIDAVEERAFAADDAWDDDTCPSPLEGVGPFDPAREARQAWEAHARGETVSVDQAFKDTIAHFERRASERT